MRSIETFDQKTHLARIPKDVWVFRTDIPERQNSSALEAGLQSIPGLLRWSLDLEDIDRILRVEAMGVHPCQVEHAVIQAGYGCWELE